MTQEKYSIKKLGTTFKLQKIIIKEEKKQEDVYADTWKKRKMNG